MELVDAPHSKCGTFGFVGSSPTAPTCLMDTYKRIPISLVKGKGCWVWDEKGKKYLDAVAGIATCTLGHSNKKLFNALKKQLNKIQHVSNLYIIPEQEELANWLVKKSCADKVFFCNSGAEANEAAIKLARKYANKVKGIKKPIILSSKSSFHGRTIASLSATGQEKYRAGFGPLLEGFEFFEYNDINSFNSLINSLNTLNKEVCAVLIEPIQGEGGIKPGDKMFFKQLRDFCSENKILLIIDEVQAGMGRTGQLWGYENLGIEPDAFTVAKGLGGGHAIGALLVKNEFNIFEAGDHASTFGGNPFACKAAITIAQELERQNILSSVIERGNQLKIGLKEIIEEFPNIFKEARGYGLIQGLEIREDAGMMSSIIIKEALSNGLLIASAGNYVVRIVPPLIISKKEINELISRLRISIIGLNG